MLNIVLGISSRVPATSPARLIATTNNTRFPVIPVIINTGRAMMTAVIRALSSKSSGRPNSFFCLSSLKSKTETPKEGSLK
ncbi:hypothetical protein IPdc08_00754 [archaeon]|nr:hypothetical protein IPdc08_00754 [archaeon]